MSPARQGAEANRQALAGTSVPSEEPEKKVSTEFPWFLMPENKEKAEAMEMAWRFLKNETGTDITSGNPGEPLNPNNEWMKPQPKKPVISEAERLANQGFTAENINRIKMQNAAARAAMNRGLHQPKGG